MKAKRIQFPPTFEIENGDRVIFKPTVSPPYTHKVLLVRQGKTGYEKFGQSWFSPSAGHKINCKTALFFWDEHIRKMGTSVK